MKLSDIGMAQPKKVMRLSDIEVDEPKGLGEELSDAISDVPRQAGMFGRFVMEGLGNTADLVTSPIRAVYDPIARKAGLPTAATDLGGMAADKIGLPQPQNKLERIAGDVVRTVAGTGGVMGAASAVSKAPGMIGKVSQSLAARPDLQLASAGGAGAGGGYIKETGGGPVAQFLASLAGGVAGAGSVAAGQKAAKVVADRLIRSPDINIQIDSAIENAIRSSGLKMSDLPLNVRDQLRQDIGQALKTGKLSPDATRRLADYRLIGATPTAANLTLDPAAITQQRNLAKMGAASKDPALQKLAQVQNDNNRVLIDNLNDMGADTDPVSASQKVIASLSSADDSARTNIGAQYTAARETTGRSASLDPSKFTQTASDKLDDALLGSKLPTDVRNKLNQIAAGEMPFTVDVAEQLKTRIGELQRASKDGAERKALGLVREALEETPLLDGQGKAAIDAFNKARAANRSWMQVVENTPALQAVRDSVEPDKFVQNFIVGNGKDATNKAVFQLRQQIKNDKEAMTAVKGAITNFLKTRALNQATDEVGNFSQSAYNKALYAIGEKKLSMFFTPKEVNQLKAIGRVASYEQTQPAGSAVNNSNTATTLVSTMLDRLGNSPILRKIPLGAEILANPAKSISTNVKATKALDASKAIALRDPKTKKLPPILLPLLIEQQAND